VTQHTGRVDFLPFPAAATLPMQPSLRQLYADHAGKVSQKWNLYLDVYDSALAPWRGQAVTLVEVGVQNGGSLELWAKYFAAGRRFVGCDVDEKVGGLVFDDPRIRTVVAPINTPAAAKAIVAEAGAPIDIFIDDGSHLSPDIILAFRNYFPALRAGGIYIAEDLHCAYRRGWQGGLGTPNAVSFFKALVDAMHQPYWDGGESMETLARDFLPGDAAGDLARLAASVASVAFFDSMCLIRKRPDDGWGRLGHRVVAGTEAAVDSAPLTAPDTGKP
jgi:hypothetical protein